MESLFAISDMVLQSWGHDARDAVVYLLAPAAAALVLWLKMQAAARTTKTALDQTARDLAAKVVKTAAALESKVTDAAEKSIEIGEKQAQGIAVVHELVNSQRAALKEEIAALKAIIATSQKEGVPPPLKEG